MNNKSQARLIYGIVFGVILFSIFSLFPIEADGLNENTKSDLIFRDNISNYGMVEIKNATGNKIATLELKKNTDTCGFDCSAEIEIIMLKDGSLIDDVKFLERQQDNSWVEKPIKNYQFYIKTGGNEWLINDYKNECKLSGTYYENGTEKTICSKIESGNHYANNFTYEKYEPGTSVPAGTYYVKLEGTRDSPKWIDWVIVSQGKELDFWYTWGEFIAIKYDNHVVGGINYFSIASNGSVMMVGTASDVFIWLMNNTYKYQWAVSNLIGTQPGGMSWNGSTWFIIDTCTDLQCTGGHPIHKYDTSLNYLGDLCNITDVGTYNALAMNATNIWAWDGLGQDLVETDLDCNILHSYDIALTSYGIAMNGSNVFINEYLYPNPGKLHKYTFDGVYVSNFTQSAGQTDSFGVTIWNESFYIMDYEDGVYQYYNAPFYSSSISSVNSTLNSPIDYYNSSAGSVTFNCSANTTSPSGEQLTNISLWLNITGNWILNETKSVSGTYNNSIFTKNIPDGKNFGWTCQAYDDSSASSFGINRTFTINTPPTIPVLLSPANNSGFAMGSTITFVWSNSTDESRDTITYDLEIYNESDMAASHLIYSNVSIPEEAGNTSINIKLSDYTTRDDDYYWRVRANTSLNYSNWSQTRHFQYANWTIRFNLTNSFTGQQIDTGPGKPNIYSISCNNGFSSSTPIENPYNASNLGVGIIECTFIMESGYLIKKQNITADGDKTINIPMSESEGLTGEEHTWLEAIYNCIIGQDCSLYNLLLEINNTVGNIWEQTKPTDESVITSETITNKIVNSTNNLTIDYTVSIPIKAGYVSGTYLPIRIGFWFLNESNTTCYNQGDKPIGVEEPYCQPLVIETIGPMGGSVSFVVKLRPELPAGDYNIKRIIDIDPLGVWYNYGSEVIGKFTLTESIANSDINLEKTREIMPSTSNQQSSLDNSGSSSSVSSSGTTTIIREKEIIKSSDNNDDIKSLDDGKTTQPNKLSITGAAIGAIFSNGSLMFIVTILCITFIIFIIISSRTIIKIKTRF